MLGSKFGAVNQHQEPVASKKYPFMFAGEEVAAVSQVHESNTKPPVIVSILLANPW
jgi:hypothetical protein